MNKLFAKSLQNYSGKRSSPISSSAKSSSASFPRVPADVRGLSGAGPKGYMVIEF